MDIACPSGERRKFKDTGHAVPTVRKESSDCQCSASFLSLFSSEPIKATVKLIITPLSSYFRAVTPNGRSGHGALRQLNSDELVRVLVPHDKTTVLRRRKKRLLCHGRAQGKMATRKPGGGSWPTQSPLADPRLLLLN